jgi:hypothetical protein
MLTMMRLDTSFSTLAAALHVSLAAEKDHHSLPTTCPDEAVLGALDPTHTS